MEQQIVDLRPPSSGTFALAATPAPKPPSGCAALTCVICGKSGHLKCCLNPKCPPEHRVGHLWPECFSEGGGRAGQHDVVLSKKAEKQHAAGKSGTVATGKPGNVQYDQSGRAYFVDLETNMVFALHDAPGATANSNSPTTEFTGLALDTLTPEVASSLPGFDADKYNAMYLDTSALLTSIDWCCHSQPMDLAALTYNAPNQCAPTTIDLSLTPFFLDTGASIHISNCESDFYRLRPVTPWAVHGVGGSAIQVIGIGSICLIIAKGIHVTLDNVLFIPGATICLISVSALTLALKCMAHFANSTCWVTYTSGAQILSGILTARRLYVVSGGHLTTRHAFAIARSPMLETWYNHLGHENYCTVANLAHQNPVTSMPLSSSPPLPPCEHCILGKQTCSSVPKVREGV